MKNLFKNWYIRKDDYYHTTWFQIWIYDQFFTISWHLLEDDEELPKTLKLKASDFG